MCSSRYHSWKHLSLVSKPIIRSPLCGYRFNTNTYLQYFPLKLDISQGHTHTCAHSHFHITIFFGVHKSLINCYVNSINLPDLSSRRWENILFILFLFFFLSLLFSCCLFYLPCYLLICLLRNSMNKKKLRRKKKKKTILPLKEISERNYILFCVLKRNWQFVVVVIVYFVYFPKYGCCLCSMLLLPLLQRNKIFIKLYSK